MLSRAGVVCMEGLMVTVTVKLVVLGTAVVNALSPAYKVGTRLHDMAQWYHRYRAFREPQCNEPWIWLQPSMDVNMPTCASKETPGSPSRPPI